MTKSLTLVGAGTAHLAFLRQWAMAPVPGVEVTLIAEELVLPYSAMVPMWLSGEQVDRALPCANN